MNCIPISLLLLLEFFHHFETGIVFSIFVVLLDSLMLFFMFIYWYHRLKVFRHIVARELVFIISTTL